MASDDRAVVIRLPRDPLLVPYGVLSALQLVPIWATRYFPTQDGPSHVENAWLLRHFFAPESPAPHYYDLNLSPFPNWFSHAAMATGMLALPPLLVERLLLSGYVVLFCVAAWLLMRSIDRDRAGLALLFLPFVHNLWLYDGFYNFVLGIPLALLVLWAWWRRRDRPPAWRGVLALNGLLLALYFCHGLTQVIAVLGVLVLAAVHTRLRLRRWGVHALTVAPASLLPVWYTLTHRSEVGLLHPSLTTKLGWFVQGHALRVYDSPAAAPVAWALVALIAGLAVATLVWGRLELGQGHLRLRLRAEDGFAMLALACLVLYLVAPDNLGGGGWVSYRLSLFPLLLLIPWLRVPRHPLVRRGVYAAASLIVLLHLGLSTAYGVRLQDGLRDFTSGVPYVAPGETLMPIVLEPYGESPRSAVYLHAASHYALQGDAINLVNYEATTDHFPLRYRAGYDAFEIWGAAWLENGSGAVAPGRYPEPVDLILVWGPDRPYLAQRWVETYYDEIHAQGRLRLYRIRPAARRSWVKQAEAAAPAAGAR